MNRRHHAALALVVVTLGVLAPAGRAQTPGVEFASFVVRGTAVGVTARESSVGAVPAGADVVVASSSLAETELTSITSTGLAALPYPTDQVLSAPGAAAGLGGIPAPPGYPLVARADHPFTPDASATPEGQPGATVTAHAEEDRAIAVADGPASAAPSDGLGLPPEAGDVVLSVGQVRTLSDSLRADDGSLQVTATTQMTDVTLLGGAFRAASVTSTATIVVRDGRAEPGPGEVSVGGATLGGAPVEVTDDGLVLGSQAAPLAPVGTATNESLRSAGIELFITPSTSEADGAKGRVTSGSLRLRMMTTANDFPLVFEVDLGAADVSTDAVLDTNTATVEPPVTEPDDVAAAPVTDTGIGTEPDVASPPSDASAGSPPSADASTGATPQGPFTPVAALRLDFRPVYGWLGLLGIAVIVARHLVRKATPHTSGPALNDLRRW